MSNPFGKIESIKRPLVEHFMGHCVVKCANDCKKSIMIPFIPGANLPGICEGCGTHYFVTGITYDNADGSIRVRVEGKTPLIQVAQGPLPA